MFNSASDLLKAYKEKINGITTDTYKPPKNVVGLYEVIFTTTAGAIPKEREEEFVQASYQELCTIFKESNILGGATHRDETTVHSHWFVTPIYDTTKILRRTREEKANGTNRKIIQSQLNATHWTGGPMKMSYLQDCMYDGVFKKFGLERGEIEFDKNNKKRNKRSSLFEKEKSLEQMEKELESEKQKIETEKKNVSIKESELNSLEKELSQKEEKVLEDEKTSVKKSLKTYEEIRGSIDYENVGEGLELPEPHNNESGLLYHIRIKPVFDAVVSKVQELFTQLKELRKQHKQEVEELKNSYIREKQNAVTEAVENAISVTATKLNAEKESEVSKLKEELQTEKREKQNWFNILFKEFSFKKGDAIEKIKMGLKDAYLEKRQQLEKWETKNSDELISLGKDYQKFQAENWQEYNDAKTRLRVTDKKVHHDDLEMSL